MLNIRCSLKKILIAHLCAEPLVVHPTPIKNEKAPLWDKVIKPENIRQEERNQKWRCQICIGQYNGSYSMVKLD